MTDVMRQEYCVLTDADKNNMKAVKEHAAAFYHLMECLGGSRETALAKTKIEEACMWAVKHITA